MSEERLPPAVAAAILGVSTETLRRWAKQNKVRHVKLPSGRRYFLRSDLEAMLTPLEPMDGAA